MRKVSKKNLIKEIQDDFIGFIEREAEVFPVPEKVKALIDELFEGSTVKDARKKDSEIVWKDDTRKVKLYYVDCLSDVYESCNKYTVVFVQTSESSTKIVPVYTYFKESVIKQLLEYRKKGGDYKRLSVKTLII